LLTVSFTSSWLSTFPERAIRSAISPMRFFSAMYDRSAQGDMAINGDDLHVPGVHGHVFGSDDFLANLRRGVDVGLAVALIERR
jgi:hypothetical protein